MVKPKGIGRKLRRGKVKVLQISSVANGSNPTLVCANDSGHTCNLWTGHAIENAKPFKELLFYPQIN